MVSLANCASSPARSSTPEKPLPLKKLLSVEERICELEGNEAARVASHLAMITAMCELGGTAKLVKFYKQYADVRDSLVRQGAMPSQLSADVVPIRK